MRKSKTLKTLSFIFMSCIVILIVIIGLICFKNRPNIEQPKDIKIIYTLTNGGFENGTMGWSIRHGFVLDNNIFHSGKTSIRADPTYYDPLIDPTKGDARASWYKRIYVKPGQKIFATVYIKTGQASCSDGLRLGIDFKKANSSTALRAHNGEWVSWGNDWTYRTINETIRTGEESITVWLQGKPYNCSASGWFDDVELTVIEP